MKLAYSGQQYDQRHGVYAEDDDDDMMDHEHEEEDDEDKIAAEENLLNEHLACVKEEAQLIT